MSLDDRELHDDEITPEEYDRFAAQWQRIRHRYWRLTWVPMTFVATLALFALYGCA